MAQEKTFTKADKQVTTSSEATASWLLANGWTLTGTVPYVPPVTPQQIEARVDALEEGLETHSHPADDTGWIEVDSYLNAWVDYGAEYGGAAYRRKDGTVYLRGLIVSPGINYTGQANIFTLPVGYRPGIRQVYAQAAAGGVIRVDVTADGAMMTWAAIAGATNTSQWVSLNGISFPV